MNSFPDGPGNLAYIMGDLWLKINDHHSLDQIDADVMKLEALCSPFTDDDTQFRREWSLIQEARSKVPSQGSDAYVQGQEGWEEVDIAFRYRELRALTRAASRNGIISRQQPARAKWNPKGTEVAA